jgi:hypothetical protein
MYSRALKAKSNSNLESVPPGVENVKCREAAHESPISGAVRHNKPGFILIAKFCDTVRGAPMFFTNVYHLADVKSDSYTLVFRANNWSESNTHYGIPSVFEENASDWKPLQIAALSALIARIEPLRQDLNHCNHSSSRNLHADHLRLHDAVITQMEGRPFVVRTHATKKIAGYSASEEEQFFLGPQTSPIAQINDGRERLYTLAGLAEQFTKRKRIEPPSRHDSVYADFLKLQEIIEERNRADGACRLVLRGSRESEKGWNLHWTFTIDVFSDGKPSTRSCYIYLNYTDLHEALKAGGQLRRAIDRATTNDCTSVGIVSDNRGGRRWQAFTDGGVEEFPLT